MAVPTYENFMLPLLRITADGRDRSTAEVRGQLASEMRISEKDVAELLPSGKQTRFINRISWAVVYLSKARLLEKVGRGRFRMTERGRELLTQNPSLISNGTLSQFEEFLEFKIGRGRAAAITRRGGVEREMTTEGELGTPEERLEAAYLEIRQALASELLDRVRANDWRFFERLVIDVLVAMGYGGSHDDAAQVVGRSGDEGIDGTIKEDRLGLDMVYVQAKKWDGSVGPAEIDRFVGSLGRKKAHKGVFITSSTFTTAARKAAEQATTRIVLIDGEELAELLIDHGVGVANDKTYTLKKIDQDYFEDLS